MLTTLNDRAKPFSYKGAVILNRVGLTLVTVPASARVLDSAGITDVVNGVLIQPINRKFPAIGFIRWLDANGRVQGEEMRIEFERCDFYPALPNIKGFEVWFRKGVILDTEIESGLQASNSTDYSNALINLQTDVDAIQVVLDNLALAVGTGTTDNTQVLAAIAAVQASINALPVPVDEPNYFPAISNVQADTDAMQLQLAELLARPSGGTVSKTSSTPASLLGTSGMTALISAFADEGLVLLVDIGFPFFWFGTNFQTSIRVSPNSFVSFGETSAPFNDFTATMPGRALCLGALDRGWNALYRKTEVVGKSVRIRYEGTTAPSAGASTHIWELTLYNDFYMQLVTGAYTATGSNFFSNKVSSTPLTIAANTSYVFTPTVRGYDVTLGSYIG